jgi:hypothetical protein
MEEEHKARLALLGFTSEDIDWLTSWGDGLVPNAYAGVVTPRNISEYKRRMILNINYGMRDFNQTMKKRANVAMVTNDWNNIISYLDMKKN